MLQVKHNALRGSFHILHSTRTPILLRKNETRIPELKDSLQDDKCGIVQQHNVDFAYTSVKSVS